MNEWVVIVAAGRGTRLGGVAKALLKLHNGMTFVERIITTARSAGIDNVVVVVAEPFGQQISQHCETWNVDIVVNQQPDRGMSSSIACGFSWLSSMHATAAGAWLWPVDHPLVNASTLVKLRAAATETGQSVIPTLVVDGVPRGGHPLRVAPQAWQALAQCHGAEQGARTVLRSLDAVRVPCDDPGVHFDCDDMIDLARMVRHG
jgi:molybdenum cofactor cytidylyltransferase